MAIVQTGLDILQRQSFRHLKQRAVGLLCNQASINHQLIHILDVFYPASQQGYFSLKAIFGPQHGLWGHTQDNMIEWEGYTDPHTGIPIYSLYGQHRKPTPEMLKGLDLMVVDLQDVGARYYTFIWTLALVMEACQEQGIAVLVLDRPNPIGGEQIEGPILHMDFRSFVGLYPIPVRHGMTIAEIARYLQQEFFPELTLEILPMEGWKRRYYFDDTGLTWAMPSPNVPIWETTLVYPGMCLLEATNLSEGRGTTRPFEIFGAPWMDGRDFARRLNQLGLPGIFFRPVEFQPTFNKFQGDVCGGCFMHVTDRQQFKPFLTTLAILRETIRLYPEHFQWKSPPYEYEYEKMPFDILVGNGDLRRQLMEQVSLEEIEASWQSELEAFRKRRHQWLLYD
ncbi:MAG: DUF1343 domain-containing protein [Calditrichaeota bacterium]|nr:DUF1343 domain-containing protein [Calditrichota bacterium]